LARVAAQTPKSAREKWFLDKVTEEGKKRRRKKGNTKKAFWEKTGWRVRVEKSRPP